MLEKTERGVEKKKNYSNEKIGPTYKAGWAHSETLHWQAGIL